MSRGMTYVTLGNYSPFPRILILVDLPLLTCPQPQEIKVPLMSPHASDVVSTLLRNQPPLSSITILTQEIQHTGMMTGTSS